MLRWRRRKESSHATCYQACRSFEIFITCLAFLLIQKVHVSAITVRSTSGELDGRNFLNFPGTFVSLFSATNLSSVLQSVTIRLKSNKVRAWGEVTNVQVTAHTKRTVVTNGSDHVIWISWQHGCKHHINRMFYCVIFLSKHFTLRLTPSHLQTNRVHEVTCVRLAPSPKNTRYPWRLHVAKSEFKYQ